MSKYIVSPKQHAGFKVIDAPAMVKHHGRIAHVLGRRSPTQYEHGAQLDLKYGKLDSFRPDITVPEYDVRYMA